MVGALLPQRARSFWGTRFTAARGSVEAFLERERGQLPPWFVVGFGAGIAAWFALDGPRLWAGFLCASAALGLAGFSARGGRAERAAGWFGLALMLGCALVWARSAYVAAPRLERPLVAEFRAKVERVETRTAKGDLRLTLAPEGQQLPPRVRVSIKQKVAPEGITAGARLQLRARLAPPPPMALPGSYDFARDAWFRGIGAVGRALGTVTVIESAGSGGIDAVRERLDRQARRHQSQQGPSEPRQPAFVAQVEQPAGPRRRVQGDDRGHSRKAHLETGPGQRLGAKDQHQQRPDRDKTYADRVPPQRDASKDEHSGDATADGGHLGAGKQRVAYSRQRADARSNQHQVEPQGEALAQSQQPERQKHRRTDRRGDVQTADRQQMR
jgi:hypothetical protein